MKASLAVPLISLVLGFAGGAAAFLSLNALYSGPPLQPLVGGVIRAQRFDVTDRYGRVVGSFKSTETGTSFTMGAPNGGKSLELFADSKGNRSLVFYQDKDRTRMALRATSEGATNLYFGDLNGEERLSLGALDLNAPPQQWGFAIHRPGTASDYLAAYVLGDPHSTNEWAGIRVWRAGQMPWSTPN
jgi:hypothetical protein